MNFRYGVLALALAVTPALAQTAPPATVKSGASMDLGQVYWIRDCRSILRSFVGVRLDAGPAGVTLSLKEQEVMAVRQQCPTPVRGAIVVLKAPTVTQAVNATIEYTVLYDVHGDGRTQSKHTRTIAIVP